jgi:hypothetical protein
MTLKTRKPTGLVPWPLILIEGGEKAGKSWMAAELSKSSRISRSLWIDLGEGAGDEYGAIPGTTYEIVEHDGTWESILAAVQDVREEARRATEAGEPPVALVIDSMTLIWDMLKDWASNRARKAPANQRLLKTDPSAEINVSANFWNDANARHRKLMTILMTFPGIAVVTARGKEVTAMTNGQPDPRKPKEYRVEGHKDLGFDATVWVRLARGENPVIVGARSVHAGIQPGEDKPRAVPGLTLERVIFDILKCNPGQAHVRDLVELQPGDTAPDGQAAEEQVETQRPSGRSQRPAAVKPSPTAVALFGEIGDAKDLDKLKAAWEKVQPALSASEITQAEADQLNAHVRTRKSELGGDNPTSGGAPAFDAEGRKKAMARMHAQWAGLNLGGEGNRVARLEKTSALVGRAIASSTDLTDAELSQVITWQVEEKQKAAAT